MKQNMLICRQPQYVVTSLDFQPVNALAALRRYGLLGLCCCLLVCLSACAGKPLPPVQGTAEGSQQPVFFFDSGLEAAPADLLTRMGRADVVLIGEQHTSAKDHQAQASIIAMLAQAGFRPAIGLEMLPAALQPELDRFNSGLISVEELPQRLAWEKVWGFDFDLYKPVFITARRYNLPVYGLNVSSSVIKEIRRTMSIEALPPATRQELPPAILLPSAPQQQKLASFFKQHSAMLMNRKARQPKSGQSIRQQARPAENSRPDKNHGTIALKRFMLVQSVWDTAMAHNAIAIEHDGPLVILAGGGHVEYGHGIAYRIRQFQPDADYVLVMPLRPKSARPGTGAADFYFTAREED